MKTICKATALLPPAHLVSLCKKEEVLSIQAEAETRYQKWAFIQGFAVVVEKNDLKHSIYVLKCIRHKEETKNSRKKEKRDYIHSAPKINVINCQFQLCITWQAEAQKLELTSASLSHNYAILSIKIGI